MWVLSTFLLAGQVYAADLTWAVDRTIELSSPDINMTVLSGSEATTFTINVGAIEVVVATGDTFTVTSASRELDITGETTSVAASSCSGSTATATVTGGPDGETITIAPKSNQCGSDTAPRITSSGSVATRIAPAYISPVPTAPVSGTTYNFGAAILRNGSRGEAVKELQRFLNATMNLGLVVDGILGPKTIAVIKGWQSANGLVPDGLVGPVTKAKMNNAILPSQPSATPAAPPTAPKYNFGTGTVVLGSQGENCKAWQNYFNDKMGAKLVADGYCGPLTIAAAKIWQQSVGLTPDGILGSLSRAKALAQ